jgi:flagellar basal-body rod modification protein FlgD
MSVQSVTGSSATTATTKSTASSTMVNKDDFLKILISQIKYQDPLEPMKPDQFLSQLSQLTQVEQLQNIAGSLESMKATADKGSMTQWLSAIGKKMNVDTTLLSRGDEIVTVPKGDYDQVILTLTSAIDNTTKEIRLKKGDSLSYTYDGSPDVAVTALAVKDGKAISCTANVYRVVKGIQIGDSGPVMVAGNGETYTVDKIKQIKE